MLARQIAFSAAMLALATTGVGQDGDALVIVNGESISRTDVVKTLMEAHGLAITQQLIVLELAKQETRRRGLEVTPADVETEFASSLNQIAPGVDASVSHESKLEALRLMLEQKNISMTEFMIGMERNAHLRKAVSQELTLNDATLREEFARTYGEKAVVRHIQIDISDAGALNGVLDQLAAGKDFAEVARNLSQNAETAPRGGEMAPFTFDDATVPAALREAAFALRVGEVSAPIRTERRYHILKLERRIPPENVEFEDVREKVQARMLERVIPRQMGQLAQELFQKAKIRFLDPKLKAEFEELLKRNAQPTAAREP